MFASIFKISKQVSVTVKQMNPCKHNP